MNPYAPFALVYVLFMVSFLLTYAYKGIREARKSGYSVVVPIFGFFIGGGVTVFFAMLILRKITF